MRAVVLARGSSSCSRAAMREPSTAPASRSGSAVGSDDELPIRGRIPLRLLSVSRSRRIAATIELADGRRARLGRRLRRC